MNHTKYVQIKLILSMCKVILTLFRVCANLAHTFHLNSAVIFFYI